ncbi:uncharacterized protein LOC116207796 [Punica granatum]|uniref:Uncharacterized protein LOC116207796 n=1 Tax=Punica granatum TaxID=22663 RepID=A0A6P8DKE2_PUNGR|nr:uncharacterized protein LOC116207796 [Punica granatum]
MELAPLKLVSAMKGSREKLGAAQRKLKVTWAPDVYDPPPTSVSHVVRRGTKQQKLSRKDKRGHKGKDFSRGRGSKDSSNGAAGKDKKKKKKKQFGQTPSSSSTSYILLDASSSVLDPKPDQVENLDMGILDTSCGSSFLKISLTKPNYPVAEALRQPSPTST